MTLHPDHGLGLAPASLWGLAVLFALMRWMVLPEFRRVRWLACAGRMALLLGAPMLLHRSLMHRSADHRLADHPGEVTPAPGADDR